MPSPLTEYDPQWEIFEGEQCQCSGKTAPGILSETNDIELAAELLAVRDEQEVDRFLGRTHSQGWKLAGPGGAPANRTSNRGHHQRLGHDLAAGRRRRARHVRRRKLSLP